MGKFIVEWHFVIDSKYVDLRRRGKYKENNTNMVVNWKPVFDLEVEIVIQT